MHTARKSNTWMQRVVVVGVLLRDDTRYVWHQKVPVFRQDTWKYGAAQPGDHSHTAALQLDESGDDIGNTGLRRFGTMWTRFKFGIYHNAYH